MRHPATTRTRRASAGRVRAWIWLFSLFFIALSPASAEISAKVGEGAISGEILVWFDESVHPDEARNRLEEMGAAEIEMRFTPGLYRVFLSPRDEARGAISSVSLEARTSSFLEQAAARPGILAAEENRRGSGGYMPGDPLIDRQWYLANPDGASIQAPPAWSLTRGSEDVTIAVLDSGILLDHPEFAGRLARNADEIPGNGIDDDGNGLVDDVRGWDFVDGDNDPTDEHGHGTWTASVLAANADNDFGIAGIDHASRLLIVRVLGADNTGSTADLIDALTYVAQQDVDLVNLSLVRFPASELLSKALNRAAEKSVLVACSGNDGPNTADEQYPGAHPATISVGATDDLDALVPFSSTGTSVSLVAPGFEIEVIETAKPYRKDASRAVSGCSFATPIVTGIAALLHSYRDLDRVDTEAYLAGSAVDLGPKGWDPDHGWGRVDAQGALKLLLADAPRAVFLPGTRGGDEPVAGSEEPPTRPSRGLSPVKSRQ